ncbi:t(6)A37 threonylcarbamoyladenosine biosynthesis protein RimN [Candidatus Ornithobacterium hominis]|uniref:L-threonylcarbamoyladenylate synthase n=1 Tax=Candidatus Ornithobacterium hominis TaxID=2497989 RepID=UPI000E5AA62E|nr:L-threonylcarbamoyladenylate synthase [Candidatus Ornithobacterium hominis]SZD73709.1 t(6)A37 threonylcarbamoyladenosine biosynthesis protein RimN [Candidatus Ornithobacterium hominis]
MQKIIEALKNNGIVLMPTDTTFGLSALAFEPEAFTKLKGIKKRDPKKTFLLLVASEAQLQRLVNVSDLAWDIMDYSEKPVTLIYDDILEVPDYLLSPEGSIGIRLTRDQNLIKIIQKVGQPLLSTSANLSGQASPKQFEEISEEIKKGVDYIAAEAPLFIPKYESSSIISLSKTGEIKVLRA